MIGLLQRVRYARVCVDKAEIAAIEAGLLVLVGVERDDDERSAERLAERLLGYRVFADGAGRMNASLQDYQGGLLLVPQFTLAADTAKGTRPGFASAAAPEHAELLFAKLCAIACEKHAPVSWGRFGADMQVTLCNDGPVTFWLEARPDSRSR